MSLILALLASAAGAGLVFLGWRREQGAALAAAGWLLAFVAILPWSWALGAEIGSCYAIMVFVCLAWAAVTWNRDVVTDRWRGVSAGRVLQRLHRPGLKACALQLLRFLLAVPVAGLASLMLASALVLPLSWSMSAKVAAVIFVFPLLWGAFSVWICAQERLLRPVLANIALCALGGLLLVA